MNKIKYIKLKKKTKEVDIVIILQELILKNTNAGLISIALHKHCRKFARELTQIPLSDELQVQDY